jgi:hypothetical protein
VAIADSQAQIAFLGTPLLETVRAGQSVLVVANGGFGTTDHPAADLALFICTQSTAAGSHVTTIGNPDISGIVGLAAAPNTVSSFGLSDIATNLTPGTYGIGLCGYSTDAADWTNNDFVQQTALIFDQAPNASSAPVTTPRSN